MEVRRSVEACQELPLARWMEIRRGFVEEHDGAGPAGEHNGELETLAETGAGSASGYSPQSSQIAISTATPVGSGGIPRSAATAWRADGQLA